MATVDCWCNPGSDKHRFGWEYSPKISLMPPPPEELNLQELPMKEQLYGADTGVYWKLQYSFKGRDVSETEFAKEIAMDGQATYTPEKERQQAMDGQILKQGTKKDEGKPRWELLAFDAVQGVVAILTFGAIKYDARNWEKGIMYGRVFGALMRHLTAWWGGEDKDLESGRSHLDHAMCELMFLSAYEKRGMTQLDDRPGK